MLLVSDWIQMKKRLVWEFGDKGKGRSYQMSGDDRDDRKYQRFLVFCLSSRKVPEMSNVILVIWKRVLYRLPVTWPTPPYLHSPQRLFRSHLPLPLTNTITTSCSSIAWSDHPWPWCWTRKDTGCRPAAAAAICQNIVQPTSQSRPLAERSVSSPDGSHAFPSRWTHLLSFRCHLHQLLEDLSSCCLLCCTCSIFSAVRWAFHHRIHVFWRLRLLHRFQGNWSWRRRSLCQAPWDLKQSLVSFGIWHITDTASIPQCHTSGSDPGMPLSTGGKWGKAVDCSLILELFWSKWSTLWGLIDLSCCTISFPGFVWGSVEFSWLSLSSTSKAHRDGSNNCREKVILKRIFSRSFSSNCNILDPIIYKVWKWLWMFLITVGQLFWISDPGSENHYLQVWFLNVFVPLGNLNHRSTRE